MDAPQFDALSKALSTGNTRRRVLGALAAVPTLGGLAGLFGGDEAEARKGKRKRRKKKKKCKPQPASQTCAGTCGNVINNCKQSVNCGPCTCTPDCTGKCAGGSDGCGGTCTGNCSTNQICDGGICQACDVCAQGCPFSEVREAVREADPGDTLYVCAGKSARDRETTAPFSMAVERCRN
jgi:hypothetical protein